MTPRIASTIAVLLALGAPLIGVVTDDFTVGPAVAVAQNTYPPVPNVGAPPSQSAPAPFDPNAAMRNIPGVTAPATGGDPTQMVPGGAVPGGLPTGGPPIQGNRPWYEQVGGATAAPMPGAMPSAPMPTPFSPAQGTMWPSGVTSAPGAMPAPGTISGSGAMPMSGGMLPATPGAVPTFPGTPAGAATMPAAPTQPMSLPPAAGRNTGRQ